MSPWIHAHNTIVLSLKKQNHRSASRTCMIVVLASEEHAVVVSHPGEEHVCALVSSSVTSSKCFVDVKESVSPTFIFCDILAFCTLDTSLLSWSLSAVKLGTAIASISVCSINGICFTGSFSSDEEPLIS